MKLRNKKTGEIKKIVCLQMIEKRKGEYDVFNAYKSLAQLTEEWEDYKPDEPLIKNEETRKLTICKERKKMGRKKSRAIIQLEYDRLCGAVNAVTDIEEMLKKFSETVSSYGDELAMQRNKLRKELMEAKSDDR